MNREITVRLYGAFRQAGAGDRLELTVADDADIGTVRRAAGERFADAPDVQALLAASAFASDTAILSDREPVPDGELSILPPVCGG
jgi:molybdopterin converting factor small subunit